MSSPSRVAEQRAHVENTAALAAVDYPPHLDAVLNRGEAQAAWREIGSWPGYAPTPLLTLPGLAASLGLATLHYKDEAGRFGLGSFKALGGAYAVARVLQRHVQARTGVAVPSQALLDGHHRALTAEVTVTCATDGNHGRSVAWGARLFGCRCVIYVHRSVSQGRVDAVASLGAEVVRHAGNYDQTVQRAAMDAAAHGWTVVSDTSYAGYTDIPRDVMHGYTLMCAEVLGSAALPGGSHAGIVDPPTHVLVPGGVGGVAAAVCASLWWHYGAQRPRLLVVEPTRAACLMESAARGERVLLDGDIETVMAGLSCGEPSLLAWQVLAAGARDFVAVTDAMAVAAMRTLAAGTGGDRPLVAGESAAAVVAALQRASAEPALAASLGLDRDARVLCFGTEGATDARVYAELVGRSADAVQAA